MMLKALPVFAVLLAASASAQTGASFPIRGYDYCTQPAQALCPEALSPKVNRPALQQCLRGHFEELTAACKMNVRDHVYLPSDCANQGGQVIDQGTCPTGKACRYTSVPHPNRCITDP
ncbi:MAG TPA: hypothetical protein VG227_06650 [Caulobacteraceae bacterium]|nr:hypothetical protein [Caulobacteraceae bacterium]